MCTRENTTFLASKEVRPQDRNRNLASIQLGQLTGGLWNGMRRPLSADHDTKENKLDEAKSEGLNDEDVEDLKTFTDIPPRMPTPPRSDADDQGQGSSQPLLFSCFCVV
jgi:hypothetical protein